MSAISSYKKQLKTANKHLANTQKDLLKVNEEIASLQKAAKTLQTQTEETRKNKVEKGLLYFNENKRAALLDRAESMPYSPSIISRLRSIDNAHWNADYVDCNTIAEFEAVEKYINDSMPAWERSPVTKIGKAFNRNN